MEAIMPSLNQSLQVNYKYFVVIHPAKENKDQLNRKKE
jgi:hypothetical protein